MSQSGSTTLYDRISQADRRIHDAQLRLRAAQTNMTRRLAERASVVDELWVRLNDRWKSGAIPFRDSVFFDGTRYAAQHVAFVERTSIYLAETSSTLILLGRKEGEASVAKFDLESALTSWASALLLGLIALVEAPVVAARASISSGALPSVDQVRNLPTAPRSPGLTTCRHCAVSVRQARLAAHLLKCPKLLSAPPKPVHSPQRPTNAKQRVTTPTSSRVAPPPSRPPAVPWDKERCPMCKVVLSQQLHVVGCPHGERERGPRRTSVVAAGASLYEPDRATMSRPSAESPATNTADGQLLREPSGRYVSGGVEYDDLGDESKP